MPSWNGAQLKHKDDFAFTLSIEQIELIFFISDKNCPVSLSSVDACTFIVVLHYKL
jgi:hypothetical protein